MGKEAGDGAFLKKKKEGRSLVQRLIKFLIYAPII